MEIRGIRFADRVFRLLERVEYRRADTLEEKHAIFRMRYDAYKRAGTVELGASGMFNDALDESDNAWLIGLRIDGELASALRLHVAAAPGVPLPVTAAFPNILEPLLNAGRTVIDGTRFAAKLEFSHRFSELPYLTLRPCFLAGEFFGADFITAACLPEHQTFYRRMFGGFPWCEDPKPYPLFKPPMVLIGHDCKALRASAYQRYPFFASAPPERARLFSRSSTSTGDVFKTIGRTVNATATA